MNEIPIYLFIFIMLITFFFIINALNGTGLFSLVASFISVILSFVLAKVSINGQLVSNHGHISTDNAIVFDTFVVQSSAQSMLFTLIGILMTIRVIMILIEQYNDIYGEVTE